MNAATMRAPRQRRLPAVGLLVVMASTASLSTPGTAAEPSWRPPTTISTPSTADVRADVAVTADGHGSLMVTSIVGSQFELSTSRRSPGSAWTAAAPLPKGVHGGSRPAVTADRTTVTAVWGSIDIVGYYVRSSRRTNGGAWTAPVDVTPQLAQYPSQVSAASNDRGDVVAAWILPVEGVLTLQISRRLSNGSWTAPVDLSDPEDPPTGALDLAVSRSGAIVVTWETGDSRIAAAYRPPDGPWAPREVISAPAHLSVRPHVAIDSQGNAVAVWGDFDGVEGFATAAHRPADGGWQQRTRLSAQGGNGFDPHVTVDPQGRFTAAWSRYHGIPLVVQSSTRAANGVWQFANDVSVTDKRAELIGLVADRHGNVTAAWTLDQERIFASRRPPNGGWPPGVEVSDQAENVYAHAAGPPVVDGRGNVTLWWQADSTELFILVASLDVVGPKSRVTAPVPAFTLGTIPVTWTATDEISAITGFRTRVASAPADGSFTKPRIWRAATTLKAATYAPATPGRTYCFTARATDAAGHVGGYSAQRCTAVPLDDRALTASAQWAPRSPASAYRDTALTAAAKGATLTSDSVSARRIALVATRRPGAGAVDVFLGKTKLGRISLASATVKAQQVIPLATFASRRVGRIRIVTVNGNPVTIDGLGVSAR